MFRCVEKKMMINLNHSLNEMFQIVSVISSVFLANITMNLTQKTKPQLSPLHIFFIICTWKIYILLPSNIIPSLSAFALLCLGHLYCFGLFAGLNCLHSLGCQEHNSIAELYGSQWHIASLAIRTIRLPLWAYFLCACTVTLSNKSWYSVPKMYFGIIEVTYKTVSSNKLNLSDWQKLLLHSWLCLHRFLIIRRL